MRPAISGRPAVAFCIVVFAAIGSLADVASNGSSCTGGGRPSCQAPDQRRCECQPSCRYFGTCCADASFHSDRAVGGGGGSDPAKPGCRPSDDHLRGSGSIDGNRPTNLQLPEDLYECASTAYGLTPTYIINRCPGNATAPRQLVELCNMSLKSNHYFDARFWPVSSNASQLVYQSVYCAFCHGETSKSVARWTTQLTCLYGTNASDAQQVLRRCKLRYIPPSGLVLPPPRCLKNMVGTCELPPDASANGSSSVGEGDGEAAPNEGEVGASPPPPQRQHGVAEATLDARCRCEPQATVWWGTTPFRNVHCAACSGLTPSQLNCTEPRVPAIAAGRQMTDFGLLDPAGPACSRCSAADEAATARCDGTNFVYDWSTQQCRQLCPAGTHLLADGGCEEQQPSPSPPPISTAASGLSSLKPAATSYGSQLPPPDDNDFAHSTAAVNVSMDGSDGEVASAACSHRASAGGVGGGRFISLCFFASLVLAPRSHLVLIR